MAVAGAYSVPLAMAEMLVMLLMFQVSQQKKEEEERLASVSGQLAALAFLPEEDTKLGAVPLVIAAFVWPVSPK